MFHSKNRRGLYHTKEEGQEEIDFLPFLAIDSMAYVPYNELKRRLI